MAHQHACLHLGMMRFSQLSAVLYMPANLESSCWPCVLRGLCLSATLVKLTAVLSTLQMLMPHSWSGFIMMTNVKEDAATDTANNLSRAACAFDWFYASILAQLLLHTHRSNSCACPEQARGQSYGAQYSCTCQLGTWVIASVMQSTTWHGKSAS